MDTTDLGILAFLVQRFIDLLITSGLCGRIKHGTLSFEFRIADSRVTYAEPSIKIGIKPTTT